MCLGKTSRLCTRSSSVSILLMTLPQLLLLAADRRDVIGDDVDDEQDDDRMTVSRDPDVANDSELAYRFCSLIRLQQLRTAVSKHQRTQVNLLQVSTNHTIDVER